MHAPNNAACPARPATPLAACKEVNRMTLGSHELVLHLAQSLVLRGAVTPLGEEGVDLVHKHHRGGQLVGEPKQGTDQALTLACRGTGGRAGKWGAGRSSRMAGHT